MADFPAQPASLNMRGSPTFFANTGITTGGTEIIAANSNRKLGVWIRCMHASVSALVGDASGTAVHILQASAAGPLHFIPGTGAIFVKSASATTDVSGYWY